MTPPTDLVPMPSTHPHAQTPSTIPGGLRTASPIPLGSGIKRMGRHGMHPKRCRWHPWLQEGHILSGPPSPISPTKC